MKLEGPTWAKLVGTVLGAGLSPVAPGTAGTLVALPVAVLLTYTPLWLQAMVLVGVTAIGTLAADLLARRSEEQDPQQIVVDEFAGMLLTLIGVEMNVWLVICGFALFRVFDITKPFPIRWLDRNVKGGWGIMLDDLAAGLLARLILFLVSVVVL